MSSARSASDGRGPVTRKRVPDREEPGKPPLLRKRSTMEASLREEVAKKGISMLQLTCMHDLGITTSRNLSLQDQELLLDTPEWRALLQAEI